MWRAIDVMWGPLWEVARTRDATLSEQPPIGNVRPGLTEQPPLNDFGLINLQSC